MQRRARDYPGCCREVKDCDGHSQNVLRCLMELNIKTWNAAEEQGEPSERIETLLEQQECLKNGSYHQRKLLEGQNANNKRFTSMKRSL